MGLAAKHSRANASKDNYKIPYVEDWVTGKVYFCLMYFPNQESIFSQNSYFVVSHLDLRLTELLFLVIFYNINFNVQNYDHCSLGLGLPPINII